jgi:DNA repair protein RAD50
MNLKIAEAQRATQDLNLNADKLAILNKSIERSVCYIIPRRLIDTMIYFLLSYVKDRRGRKLEECAENIEQHGAQVKELSEKIDVIRETIREMDKEINASGASVANLRDNIRVRKLAKEIVDTQTEIDSYDMEEAAKARRNFEEKYGKAKEKENSLQTTVSRVLALWVCLITNNYMQYSHLAGEVSSLQSQLKGLESDLKEFKDIYKRYTDQLIQVKVIYWSCSPESWLRLWALDVGYGE